MKLRNHADITTDRNLTIMLFGQAKLVQTSPNQVVLKGGTKDDKIEATEFVSMFMHEAVLSFAE
jgi:hypothetical protein